jgi:hypothetical protein
MLQTVSLKKFFRMLLLILAVHVAQSGGHRRRTPRRKKYLKRPLSVANETLALIPMTMWSASQFEEPGPPSVYVTVFCLCGLTTSVVTVTIWTARLCRGEKGRTMTEALPLMRSRNEVL